MKVKTEENEVAKKKREIVHRVT